jgi:hypothetical protein
VANEVVLNAAQIAEIRPALLAFQEAQSRLVMCARLIIVGAGEDPNRYSGNISVEGNGGVIFLNPIVEAAG